uniref:Uncharacterized protein n=1 Tax=Oryza nivara TaxID=4536 RepID=A0A0E0G937_ORYNI
MVMGGKKRKSGSSLWLAVASWFARLGSKVVASSGSAGGRAGYDAAGEMDFLNVLINDERANFVKFLGVSSDILKSTSKGKPSSSEILEFCTKR